MKNYIPEIVITIVLAVLSVLVFACSKEISQATMMYMGRAALFASFVSLSYLLVKASERFRLGMYFFFIGFVIIVFCVGALARGVSF